MSMLGVTSQAILSMGYDFSSDSQLRDLGDWLCIIFSLSS